MKNNYPYYIIVLYWYILNYTLNTKLGKITTYILLYYTRISYANSWISISPGENKTVL